MGDSIKSRIIKRLLDLAEPLRTDTAEFRVIERKHTLFLLEPIKPALHLVIGDEHQMQEDERGYWMQFPAWWKIMVADSRDAYSLTDDTAAYLQTAIEVDNQLSQLANKIVYDGTVPFTDEVLKPDGGAVVMYTVEYRRMRGDPNTSY